MDEDSDPTSLGSEFKSVSCIVKTKHQMKTVLGQTIIGAVLSDEQLSVHMEYACTPYLCCDTCVPSLFFDQ